MHCVGNKSGSPSQYSWWPHSLFCARNMRKYPRRTRQHDEVRDRDSCRWLRCENRPRCACPIPWTPCSNLVNQGPDITPAPHIETHISTDTWNIPLLHPSRSSPRPIYTCKRPLGPKCPKIDSRVIAKHVTSPRPILRPRPEISQAATLLNVPNTGWIFFIRLRFSSFN